MKPLVAVTECLEERTRDLDVCRQTWTACILLSTAIGSSAATLGGHRGAATFGQPLDVQVQLLLGPGEDPAHQCVAAEVSYGDIPVPPDQVRSSARPAAAGAPASVRIQTVLPVNEPVVTLDVRAGCANTFMRRYVLLADPLVETTAAAASAPAQAAAVGAPAPSAAPAPEPSAATRPAVRRERPVAATSPRPAGTASPPPRSATIAPRPVASPRLRLEPVDLAPNVARDPVLRLSPQIAGGSDPAPDAVRAAAAERWRAIQATPEDVMRDAHQLAALEAEAAELRQAKTRDEARLSELRAQLEQARGQPQGGQPPLVYLLAVLLLLALLTLLGLALRRRREAPAAVQGSEASRAWWSAPPDDKFVPDSPASVPMPPVPSRAPASRHPAVDLDLDEDSSFGAGRPLGAESRRHGARETLPVLPARDRRDFSASAMGGARSMAAEELFDVQQQADFFISLGEDEQAIAVLREHLVESHEPSPLAYLDLFKLYHRLGRRDDYGRLRDEFNQVFNAGAPPFEHYADAGRGLEAYETAFSRIQTLWPQPRVLDLIERSIFRDTDDDEVEVFDLEAYRELLLLHAIAKDLIEQDGRGHAEQMSSTQATPSGFHHTKVQPLKASGRRQDSGTARPSPLPVDIDLDDLAAPSSFEASLPEAGKHSIDFEPPDFILSSRGTTRNE